MPREVVKKTLIAIVDNRTTAICIDAAGQVKPVDEPFDTLAGSYIDPPFHTNCRSYPVPWMPGMEIPEIAEREVEIARRGAERMARDRAKAGRIPGPDVDVGAVVGSEPVALFDALDAPPLTPQQVGRLRTEEIIERGEIRSILNDALSFEHAGIRARVDDARHDDVMDFSFLMVFEDAAGNRVGGASRFVRRRSDTGVRAHHSRFELDPEVQGQGIATVFNRQLDSLYRQLGVEAVELHANIDVGGYAWARAGFDWAGPDDARSVAKQMQRNLQVRTGTFREEMIGFDAEVWDGLEEVVDAVDAGMAVDQLPTPFEFSRIGFDRGNGRMWLGKELMLGTGWRAIKWL